MNHIAGYTVLVLLACGQGGIGTAQVTEVVLHDFAYPRHGQSPYAAVIRDSAGNLFGTASGGGTTGAGMVFRLDSRGRETVLYSFKGGADGERPETGVIRDAAGNFYGSTGGGGLANAGVVYKLDTAGNETVLYTFTGGQDGRQPNAVIRDAAGNIYGTTSSGGAAGLGVVFELSAAGQETVLHSFTGGSDGSNPLAGVIRDAAGNFYGTTTGGGTGNAGMVYELKAGRETVFYTFTGGIDGFYPVAGVTRDAAGNLYGTTAGGGSGSGVVFRLDAAGHETVLHNFAGGADGAGPQAGVIRDAAGNLYGSTLYGGMGNAGVVYKVDAGGHETALYSFTGGSDGNQSYGGVTRDAAGNIYGTTIGGGASNLGVVYKLDAAGHETVLYSFPSGPDGYAPFAGVTRDAAGNLYGTTLEGGSGNAGTVYKVDASGHETVLYSFMGGDDGSGPSAGVTLDAAGNLYGTTTYGGAGNAGVVYRVDAGGHETVLYSFGGGGDGGSPQAGVTRDAAGNLYGTTVWGGTGFAGVVYKVASSGRETVLYNFTGNADGGNPASGVILDAEGNLYGTTSGIPANAGVVYKVDRAGHETVLYTFTGAADGGYPYAGVVRDAAGTLYGTTYYGGTENGGVVYRLDTAGRETVLHNFRGGTDGRQPYAGVIADAAGNLYGTTEAGGTANGGVVYKLDAGGKETILHSFTGAADGRFPQGGVILDAAGNLYGTTAWGGAKTAGLVFVIQNAAAE